MQRFIVSKPLVQGGFALVLEQLTVASSTFWLALIGKNLSEGKSPTGAAVGFVSSLTIVYIPSIIKASYFAEAKVVSLQKYVEIYRDRLNCVPQLSRSKNFQNQRRQAIETEALLVIDETVNFLSFAFTIIANVLFNILALPCS